MKIEKHPQELLIASKIIGLREENVLLDLHLAEFYDVETPVLKQAVRRNKDRFPNDFLFELTDDEVEALVSQNVIPSKSHFGGATPIFLLWWFYYDNEMKFFKSSQVSKT